MGEKLENDLLTFEVEKEQTVIRLKDAINNIRYTLDNLESKLDNNSHLFESDGLQGNAVQIDAYLTKIVTYERVISRLKKN